MLDFKALVPSLPFILEGALITIKISLIALLAGLPWGVVLGICKVSSRFWLKYPALVYTSVFRGTPLLVQLGLVFFGLPQVTQINLSPFEAGVITFALNSAAYTSEIIRAGIQAVPLGQWEAATVLGLSKPQTLVHIIIPQAFRQSLPALINEMINLLKESALISTLGGTVANMELYRRVQIVASEKYMYFEPLIIAGIAYYIMVFVISSFGYFIEKKLRYA